MAQELERRERERLRYEEQKSFEALRSQYGMVDNDGNYVQQTLAGMQRAVHKGEMSVVDFYERQVSQFPELVDQQSRTRTYVSSEEYSNSRTT